VPHSRLGAAAAAAALCVAQSAGASAPSPAISGTEHFQSMSTSVTARTGQVIAYGPFTAVGTAPIGPQRVGKAVFPSGTITISHQRGKGGGVHVNPRTCLVRIAETGTCKILRGTGAYAGITGHGTYRLSLVQVAARVSGACSQKAPPAASQEFLQAIRSGASVTRKPARPANGGGPGHSVAGPAPPVLA